MDLKGNLHENNFEDFIKNKINEFDELPSSDMWERIEGVIPPKPKPAIVKYFTPISVAASVVLVVALWAAVYQFQSQNQQLSKKLDKASQQIEELNLQVQELNSNTNETIVENKAIENTTVTSNSDAIDSQKEVINPSISSNTNNSIQNNTPKKSKSPISFIQANAPKSINDNYPANQKTATSLPMAIQEVEKQSSILQENQQLTIEKERTSTVNQQPLNKQNDKVFADNIDFIESKSLSELGYISTLNKIISVAPLAPNTNNVRKADLSNWSLTLMTGPLWSRSNQRPKPGQNPSPDFRKPDEMSRMGLANSFKVNYQINNRWAVSSGLNYQREIVNLNIHQKVPYNQGGEIPFDDDFMIANHNFQANCNYGSMGINVDFFRDRARNPIGNAPIDVAVKGFHKKRSVNIPFTAQYYFNPESRVKIGLKGGLAAQLLLSSEFEPTQVEVSEEGVIAQGVTLTQSPQLSERASLDGIVGTQVLYKLNDHIQFNFEPTLVWALTDKHRSPNGNTKSGYGATQFGLTYLF